MSAILFSFPENHWKYRTQLVLINMEARRWDHDSLMSWLMLWSPTFVPLGCSSLKLEQCSHPFVVKFLGLGMVPPGLRIVLQREVMSSSESV